MDESIIDLDDYLKRKEASASPARTTFSVWGGEGERSRFALPLWRAAYLAGGTRAALAWEPAGETPASLTPFVVLDLAEDPARTRIPGRAAEPLRSSHAPPVMAVCDSGLVSIYLGEREGRRWYLVVSDPPEPVAEAGPGRDARDDLHFLAGECAALLFHRELDEDA